VSYSKRTAKEGQLPVREDGQSLVYREIQAISRFFRMLTCFVSRGAPGMDQQKNCRKSPFSFRFHTAFDSQTLTNFVSYS
jgi:hypothetical protein